jgi:hypothetical protein
MKCTECGRDFEPDCAQEEICKPCQYEDVPEAHMRVVHTSTACPECDDVSNQCCRLCHGTDQYCPDCCCPAEECEFREGMGDEDYEA